MQADRAIRSLHHTGSAKQSDVAAGGGLVDVLCSVVTSVVLLAVGATKYRTGYKACLGSGQTFSGLQHGTATSCLLVGMLSGTPFGIIPQRKPSLDFLLYFTPCCCSTTRTCSCSTIS